MTLTGSGGPSGYSAHFTYCAANAAGTACTGPVVDCGLGACDFEMDDDYRATLDWVDTSPPSQAALSGPGKAGPTVRQFTASATDNSGGVTAMRFVLDGVSQPLDTSPPFQFDVPVGTLTEGEHTLVALARDGADVGWLQSRTESGTLFLAQLFVAPALQRQGIGTAVMNRIMAEAEDANQAVTLGVVKTNPALRLYRRLGFHTTHEDDRKFYMRRQA